MSIRRTTEGRWEVRWYLAGRGSPRRQRSFDRKTDAAAFDAEIRRRRALGGLALFEQRNRTAEELAGEWWRKYAVPNLAHWTLTGYERMLVSHIQPRLGAVRVGEITPEVVADFRERLEAAGVGRHSVRLSLVVLQAMFKQAVRWGWLQTNPVKAVPKPSAKRERAVVCLAPSQVEAIRNQLLASGKLYAAGLVSLVAYQGLRVPEEVLALEVRHVRAKTLLGDQRNIAGDIVAGQKVRGFHPRAIDWVEPAGRDVTDYLVAAGIRSGLLFPRADDEPWRLHDYKNWCRRVWHPAVKRAEGGPSREDGVGRSSGLPPYDLRHAFASLQIRAGLSIPEIAKQMGHSPQMTIATYAHVIRELKGLPALSAEEQIEQAREARGRQVDVSVEG